MVLLNDKVFAVLSETRALKLIWYTDHIDKSDKPARESSEIHPLGVGNATHKEGKYYDYRLVHAKLVVRMSRI